MCKAAIAARVALQLSMHTSLPHKIIVGDFDETTSEACANVRQHPAGAAPQAGLDATGALSPKPAHPKVRADLRRQGKLLAKHPENDAIDAWIEAVYDWSDWK